MNKLLSYLKYRRLLLLFFLVSVLLILLFALLTDGSIPAAIYLCALLLIVLLVMLLFDGIFYFRRRRLFMALADNAAAATAALPAPMNGAEEYCFALIAGLASVCRRLTNEYDSFRRDQLGYYTLWVHQIKTPIAAMLLVLQNMPEGTGAVLRQELFKIEQYADLALRYAKLGDIASDLVAEECSVESAVRESVKKFALPFIYQGLSIDISPIDKHIITDKRWFCFIIDQILSNAVKYTPHGGVSISLCGNTLNIADTGIGIRPEDLPRIFERGYTGYNGRIDGRASGVGLYLAKKAADSLGISIAAESAPGRGTTFRLSLPEKPGFLFE